MVVRARMTACTLHFVRRNPSRVVKLCLDLFTAHFLCNVRDTHPQHANRCRTITRFVIYRELDFVRLVNVDRECFVYPLVVAGCFRSGFDGIFNLDDDICFRTARETGTGGMVDILDGMDSHCEKTGQRLAHVRAAKAFICKKSVIANLSSGIAFPSLDTPSAPSEDSIST